MKKQERIRIGDYVEWNGSPKELSVWREGEVIDIHKGIAKVNSRYSANKIRLVPINILHKTKK